MNKPKKSQIRTFNLHLAIIRKQAKKYFIIQDACMCKACTVVSRWNNR